MSRRARPNAEQLFSQFPFHGLQEHQRQTMATAINDADPELIRTGDVDELTREFTDRFRLDAPTLIEGALSVSVHETQVDVTGDFMFGAFGPGQTYVPGIRAEYYVPYSGDRNMFQCSASTRNMSLRSVELREQELLFAYERPDQDIPATKAEFDKEVAQIRQSLEWLTQDCQRFNAGLPAQARELITARRIRLSAMNTGIQDLGISIRKAPTAAPTVAQVRPVTPASPARDVLEQYDIALSFAGENRDYVEEVAKGLKAAGVNVFYDAFESANLWGKNLIDHLAKIYKSARYVVMFISAAYVHKAWTTHERKHAQERELFAQEEYILPARFDDTDVPGMTKTVGYQDLRKTTPEQLVELIITKLHRS